MVTNNKRTTNNVLLGCVLLLLQVGCVTTTQNGKKIDEDKVVAAQIGLAKAYIQSGKAGQARPPLEKALEYDSRSGEAYSVLAMVNQLEGENELAEKSFRKAISYSDEPSDVHNNYGAFLYAQGRYEEALEQLDKAASNVYYPKRSYSYQNMGLVALKLGKKTEAQHYFEKGLRLNKRLPRAYFELAEIFFQQKKYTQAKEHYEQFKKLSRQNARSLLLGVQIAKVFQDNDVAASYGLMLKKMYPGSEELKQYQGLLSNEE